MEFAVQKLSKSVEALRAELAGREEMFREGMAQGQSAVARLRFEVEAQRVSLAALAAHQGHGVGPPQGAEKDVDRRDLEEQLSRACACLRGHAAETARLDERCTDLAANLEVQQKHLYALTAELERVREDAFRAPQRFAVSREPVESMRLCAGMELTPRSDQRSSLARIQSLEQCLASHEARTAEKFQELVQLLGGLPEPVRPQVASPFPLGRRCVRSQSVESVETLSPRSSFSETPCALPRLRSLGEAVPDAAPEVAAVGASEGAPNRSTLAEAEAAAPTQSGAPVLAPEGSAGAVVSESDPESDRRPRASDPRAEALGPHAALGGLARSSLCFSGEPRTHIHGPPRLG